MKNANIKIIYIKNCYIKNTYIKDVCIRNVYIKNTYIKFKTLILLLANSKFKIIVNFYL